MLRVVVDSRKNDHHSVGATDEKSAKLLSVQGAFQNAWKVSREKFTSSGYTCPTFATNWGNYLK